MGINNKKQGKKEKKVNPFELKFNKSKHDILGRKKGAQVGAPTASRKRAHEQREKTLGVEYDRKNKISKIVDKRLGERDDKTEEEKGAMRFTEERVKSYKRSSKFNLTDDLEEEEVTLTHKGKSLSDIEKYDKSMISDSDEDDEPGNLGSAMVKVAHFGGGEKTAEEMVREKISREDMISNLIAKTKLARHEKQQQKDELELMTESLDSKYAALMGKMKASFRTTGRQPLEKDDYDKLTITLKTEADARATPADRKLSEEEEALKEKERLDSLEAARISKSNAALNSGKFHVSADADVDVDAGTKADSRKLKAKNSRFEVRFDEKGGLVGGDDVARSRILKAAGDSEEDSEESDDDLNDEEEEEEDLDDLMEDEEELEDSGDEEEVQKKAEEVPFVFEMPKNYKKFCALLEQYGPESMETVLERLVKCHHPSLKEGNKKRLNKMFLMCLRWFDDMAKEEIGEQTVKEMNLAQKTMHALMKFDIQYGVRCIRALIRQHWKLRQEKESKSAVSFGLISAIRLVSGLFPVADQWHPVVVPAFFLATEALCSAKIPSLSVLAKQIQLANALVEYVAESKRYVPELVAFARSALLLAVVEKPEKFATNGFPISKPHSEMLCVKEKVSTALQPISLSSIFNETPTVGSEPSLKITVLRALLSLIQHLRVIYSNQSETYNIVFEPFLKSLSKIETEHLPGEVKEELETLVASMKAEIGAKRRLVHLSLVKTEKSMLKMLEPRFEWDFDPERPHKGAKDEKKKLTKNLRNEQRGAIKELRKDTAFLARKQMSSVKSKDRARIAATKRVMGGLMQQQGEWNKEKRTADVEKKKKDKK